MSAPKSSLGYALLGLMFQEPRTGYALRMVFEETPMGVYSSSPGSIYPALKRLSADGLAERAGGDGAPYRITRKGKAALKRWLTAPVADDDVRKDFGVLMLKLAFMPGLAAPADVRAFFTQIADRLDAFAAEAAPFLDRPEIPAWSRMALEQGVDVMRVRAAWARACRGRVREDEEEVSS